MTRGVRTARLVIVEDDEDDFMLAKAAFEKAHVADKLDWVKDGAELLDFLRRRGDSEPMIILLDLNLPRMDGREALAEIKSDPALRMIPVIVLTTSKSEDDVQRSYEMGVCSYIRKPLDFETFIEAAKTIQRYWLELVELPASGGAP